MIDIRAEIARVRDEVNRETREIDASGRGVVERAHRAASLNLWISGRILNILEHMVPAAPEREADDADA